MRYRVLLLALSLIVPACGGGQGGGEATATTGSVTTFADPGIQTFPDEGRTQVPAGTDIQYDTDPPTSGLHYPDPQPGGFYTDPVAAGSLVSSMENGGVIIYYDAAPLTAPDLDSLRLLAEAHPGDSSQVVVVPRTDPLHPIILTAWTHMLPLDGFDQGRIDNFIALFLGKGPENS